MIVNYVNQLDGSLLLVGYQTRQSIVPVPGEMKMYTYNVAFNVGRPHFASVSDGHRRFLLINYG
jgi:hypothetical protein